MRENVNVGHNLFRQFFSAKRIREIDLLVHYPAGTQQKRLEKLKTMAMLLVDMKTDI